MLVRAGELSIFTHFLSRPMLPPLTKLFVSIAALDGSSPLGADGEPNPSICGSKAFNEVAEISAAVFVCIAPKSTLLLVRWMALRSGETSLLSATFCRASSSFVALTDESSLSPRPLPQIPSEDVCC